MVPVIKLSTAPEIVKIILNLIALLSLSSSLQKDFPLFNKEKKYVVPCPLCFSLHSK